MKNFKSHMMGTYVHTYSKFIVQKHHSTRKVIAGFRDPTSFKGPLTFKSKLQKRSDYYQDIEAAPSIMAQN